MAWDDVPAKLHSLAMQPYAQPGQKDNLLRQFGAVINGDATVEAVPVHRRAEFEEKLDYYIEACKNLETSRAVRP